MTEQTSDPPGEDSEMQLKVLEKVSEWASCCSFFVLCPSLS